MAKRIYRDLSTLDPRQLADLAKAGKISLSRLQQAAQGKIKLSAAELERISIAPDGGGKYR